MDKLLFDGWLLVLVVAGINEILSSCSYYGYGTANYMHAVPCFYACYVLFANYISSFLLGPKQHTFFYMFLNQHLTTYKPEPYGM